MPTLWLPPKVWFHGSQSSSTGGASPKQGKVCSSICWLLHSMRCVVVTALGCRVEPEVSRNLAIVSGPTRALAASTSAGSVSSSDASRVAVRPATSPWSITISACGGTTAPIAPANSVPSVA